MFSVSLTNFGTHFPDRFDSFEAAVDFAKTKGFEATIHNTAGGVAGKDVVAYISGAARWNRD